MYSLQKVWKKVMPPKKNELRQPSIIPSIRINRWTNEMACSTKTPPKYHRVSSALQYASTQSWVNRYQVNIQTVAVHRSITRKSHFSTGCNYLSMDLEFESKITNIKRFFFVPFFLFIIRLSVFLFFSALASYLPVNTRRCEYNASVGCGNDTRDQFNLSYAPLSLIVKYKNS